MFAAAMFMGAPSVARAGDYASDYGPDQGCGVSDPDTTIAACTTMLADRHGDDTRACLLAHRADAYAYKGQYDLALADLAEAIPLWKEPPHLYGLAIRAEIYAATDKPDLAIADADMVIAHDGACDNRAGMLAYTARGIANAKLGHNDLALADFDKAIAIDWHDAVALYNRGLLRRAMGDKRHGDYDIYRARQQDRHLDRNTLYPPVRD